MSKNWIGVDLDGTLAYYNGWKGVDHIGEPIPRMLERVKKWIADGIEVRIFTARVSSDSPEEREEAEIHIRAYCLRIGLPALKVTCKKDFAMVSLWDDRAVHVIENEGIGLGRCTLTKYERYSA